MAKNNNNKKSPREKRRATQPCNISSDNFPSGISAITQLSSRMPCYIPGRLLPNLCECTSLGFCHSLLINSCRSHVSAISEVITGRVEDTCPDDSSDNNGQAKADMGIAKMDIHRSEIACECRREISHIFTGAVARPFGRLRRCDPRDTGVPLAAASSVTDVISLRRRLILSSSN